MEQINSDTGSDQAAIAAAIKELEYYDSHPTEIEELFIPQYHLRRLVQMAQRTLEN